MPDGKWISGLSPAMPVPEAARVVLRARLDMVRHFLDLALQQADQDPEHVHQLRVGTRRAAAALRIFSLCVPRKVSRKVRKRLGRLRRAGGEARDWDVFLIGLGARPGRVNKSAPGADFLLGYALGRRHAAQIELDEAAPGPESGFERVLEKTVEAVRKPKSRRQPRTLLALGRSLLAELAGDLDEATAQDLDDPDNLHRVRILGKRLRYAMEVFADCFPPAFRETVYPAVKEMQEILGRANDSRVALGHLTALRDRLRESRPGEWQRVGPAVESLVRSQQRQLRQERRRFDRWLGKWNDSEVKSTLMALVRRRV